MLSCKKNLFFISIYGFLMMFLSHQVSSSTDTIFPSQSLSGFETIVSSGGVFELGFFSQGTSNLFYLGIWYKQVIPKSIVWVANRENPAPYITSINLGILYGNLVLYSNFTESRIWWSAGLDSMSRADVQAVLLDNGNLILRDGPTSSAVVLWESFDNPSDTWLPGAKLWLGNNEPVTRSKFLTSWKALEDPSPGRYSLEVDPITKNSLIMVSNGSRSYWWSGAWDNQLRVFKDVSDMRFNRNLTFEFNVNESYVTYSVRYQTPFRLVMDVLGQLKAYTWLEKDQVWNFPWSAPDHKCKVYGYCGRFGICDENSFCKCAPTFRRQFLEEWYSNDSFGCVSEINFNSQCGKRNDKFLPLQNMKLATEPEEKVLAGTPITTCDSACLDYCFCKTYAYDGNRCLIWTSDVFNLQQLDANDSEGRTFYVRLTYSEDFSNEGDPERTKHRKVRNIVLAVLLLSVAATILFYRLYSYFSSSPGSKIAQKGGMIDAADDDGEHMIYLNLHDIMAATNAFSEENKLGEGGFGPVYKGKLPNGVDVAIKRLSKKSSQGLIEFKKEVVLIIKLQHKNLEAIRILHGKRRETPYLRVHVQ